MKHVMHLGLIGLLGAAGVAAAQPAVELQLCLAGAADYSPVYPSQSFPAGSTEAVSAVVRLGKGQSYRTLGATWVAVDVGKAAPRNPVISKTTIPMQGKDRAAIHLKSRAGALPPGKYRLDVTADNKPWRSVEFSIVPVTAPVVRQPGDLLPLKPGMVWRYAFEQQFAPGVKPELPPGTKLDADGRLRTTLTKTAVAQDSMGLHIAARRGEEVVEEEWWKLTDAGLVVTKTRSGGDEETFDPPGQIWPWPLETPRRWTYQLPDGSVGQAFRMWGPLPVKGPAGETPGYVVLMEQASSPIAVSVERHYVPGIGMVREVVVQARNGVMLTRWESIPTAKP